MGSYTGAVPTFNGGELTDADKLDEVTDFMTAGAGGWTTGPAGVPAWAMGAGVPAIGNGALTGRFRRVGQTVDWQWSLAAGATTTFGTAGAFWQMAIPGGGIVTAYFHGSGWFTDASTGQQYILTWRMDPGTGAMRLWRTASGVNPSEFLNNSPVTLATGDVVTCNGTVEIA